MPINIPWAQEFSGSPASWTQHSHPRGSGLTPAGEPRACKSHGAEKKGGGNRQTKPKADSKDKKKQAATTTIKKKKKENKRTDR